MISERQFSFLENLKTKEAIIMKNRSLLVIVLFFILGSVALSSTDVLSYTFKSVFYSIALIVLLVIGLFGLYNYLKK